MVAPAIIGAGISAGSNLLGGLMNMFQGDVAQGRAQDNFNNQMAQQREYATTGITWRGRDVMRAYGETGIHPLALLGVQGPSYTPMNWVGSNDTAMGDAVARSGQDVSRAIAASSDAQGRDAMMRRFDGLTSERMGLENELLRARIASERMRLIQGTGPGAPSVSAKVSPTGVMSDWERLWHQDKGTVPDITYSRTEKGGLMPVPSKPVKELIEDNIPHQLSHFWRNNVLPWITHSAVGPGRQKAPEGYQWEYQGSSGWQLVKQARNSREMLNRFKRGW